MASDTLPRDLADLPKWRLAKLEALARETDIDKIRRRAAELEALMLCYDDAINAAPPDQRVVLSNAIVRAHIARFGAAADVPGDQESP